MSSTSARQTLLATSELLTVIITTSPTPSAPLTELLATILQSFSQYCPVLLECRVIVVLDNYEHIALEPRLKKGHVTAEQARDFDLYKVNVKKLILDEFHPAEVGRALTEGHAEAEYGLPRPATTTVLLTTEQTEDKRVTFIESSKRIGFGLAVRSALRMTETPYVWVHQHDWVVTSDLPVPALLDIMTASDADEALPVKYVCLVAVRMLQYAISADVVKFPMLKELTAKLKRDFIPPAQPEVKIPLTPIFFWHDKPHIASTEHYLARVFPTRLAMLRGDFIEDKIGQKARQQMKEGNWSKWACWLYYPNHGKQICVRHLQGRFWRGTENQAKQVAMYQAAAKRQKGQASGA